MVRPAQSVVTLVQREPLALAMVVSSASALVLLPAVLARFRPAFLWSTTIPAPAPYLCAERAEHVVATA